MLLKIVISCLSSGPHRYVLLAWQQQKTVSMESPRSRFLLNCQYFLLFEFQTFGFDQTLVEKENMGIVGFEINATMICCLYSTGQFQ